MRSLSEKAGKPPEELTPEEVRRMAAFANAAGALAVTRKGAIPALPLLDEIRAFAGG